MASLATAGRQQIPDHREQTPAEPHAEVHLRPADEAAVVAHHGVIVRDHGEGTGAEGMAVDGRHRGRREGEDPTEHLLDRVHVGDDIVRTLAGHPLDVETVGVVLARPRW